MQRIHRLTNKSGFTILELLISMTLFTLIITSVIIVVQSLSVNRVKSLNRIALTEELYFFSEQLFTKIKDGGTLDYEEYWNRQAKGVESQSGYYRDPTGVGNYGGGGILGNAVYGSGIYLCRSSGPSSPMGTGGCLDTNNNGADGAGAGNPLHFSGAYQRYGEYMAQFMDYNGNADNDLGDENGDGTIVGDDDDRGTGDVPSINTGSMLELYLINKQEKTRTYFRWYIKQDPNNTVACSITKTGTGFVSGPGCIGNIQILRLNGLDIGYGHSGSTSSDKTAYDGNVDTWVCTENSLCTSNPVYNGQYIATGSGGEWINLFPNSINVKRVTFDIYPVKDPWLSWGAEDCSSTDTTCKSPFIHPYVRINLDMGFSMGKRRTIKNEDPTISIATSISLNDFE